MKKEEIRLLVKFAIWGSKKVDIYNIKRATERFISCQPEHLDDWLISGKEAKDYKIPELPILLEILREEELKRVKGELEELESSVEMLEDKDEFKYWVNFMDNMDDMENKK